MAKKAAGSWTALLAALLAAGCGRSSPAAAAQPSPAPAPTQAARAPQPLAAGAVPGTAHPLALRAVPVALPLGAPGIGLDDLGFAGALHRVLVPAARSGTLDLIDPDTGAVSAVPGFSAKARYAGGHDFGVTSADSGDGLLFAVDRSSHKLSVVDPGARAIVASAPLAASPDYVRFVQGRRELWVTEPDRDQIEIFALPRGPRPTPQHLARIAIAGGPESLVIDAARGRAYTHLWHGATLAIDLQTRGVVARFDNGCGGSRGIALDSARDLLFAGCAEGKAVVLQASNGHVLDSATVGAGVDIIDYDARRARLSVPSARSATLSVFAVSPRGKLTRLVVAPAVSGAHCVTSDDRGRPWVCDPGHGRLLRFEGLPNTAE